MVLDPIPQSLPVHFFWSRPQPPTSHNLSSFFSSFCTSPIRDIFPFHVPVIDDGQVVRHRLPQNNKEFDVGAKGTRDGTKIHWHLVNVVHQFRRGLDMVAISRPCTCTLPARMSWEWGTLCGCLQHLEPSLFHAGTWRGCRTSEEFLCVRLEIWPNVDYREYYRENASLCLRPRMEHIALWLATDGSIPYILVLAGRESSYSEITEYMYFSLI